MTRTELVELDLCRIEMATKESIMRNEIYWAEYLGFELWKPKDQLEAHLILLGCSDPKKQYPHLKLKTA